MLRQAQKIFRANINEHTTFEEMVNLMKLQYNSRAQQLRVQADLESLDFTSFTQSRNIGDAETGLSSLVEHINTQTYRLDARFGVDEHMTTYLRDAVLRMPLAKTLIFVITSQQYSYHDLIFSFREPIQLDVERSDLSNMFFGQYTITRVMSRKIVKAAVNTVLQVQDVSARIMDNLLHAVPINDHVRI